MDAFKTPAVFLKIIRNLEFPYNASENSQPSAEGIETGPGKKEGIVNKPP